MKASLLLLVLQPLLVSGADYKWANETVANYVNFPQAVQGRLDSELALYKSNGYPLPTVRVFQTLPETEPRVWMQLKSITARLNPSMWPHAQYNMTAGQNIGCRIKELGKDETVPAGTDNCRKQCIHQGRYCLEDAKGGHIKSTIKELTRRLCLDTIYHAKDPRFIKYIETFDANNCWHTGQASTTRTCSIDAMHAVGLKWSDLESCVAETDEDNDVEHPVLERNLRHLAEMKTDNPNHELPAVTINGKIPAHHVRRGQLSTAGMFDDYCNAFPTHEEQPLACHICKSCGNVRDCLWTLKCDGEPFHAANVAHDVLSLTAHPDPAATTPRPTKAPHSLMNELQAKDPTPSPTTPSPTRASLMDQMQDTGKRPTPAPVASVFNQFHDDRIEPTRAPTTHSANQHHSAVGSALHGHGEDNESHLRPKETDAAGGMMNNFHHGSGDAMDQFDPSAPNGNNEMMDMLHSEDKPMRKDTDSSYDPSGMMSRLDDESSPDESSMNYSYIFWGVCLTVGPLLCGLAFAWYYSKFRQERKRQLLSEIAAGKYSPEGIFSVFTDNINAASGGNNDRDEESGDAGKVRNRAEEILRANSAKDLKLDAAQIAALADAVGDTSSEDEEPSEEGMENIAMGEESEWAENKRSAKLPDVV